MLNYADKKTQQEICHIFSDLDLCGCGTSAPYRIIGTLLEHVAVGGRSFYDPIDDMSGDVVEFVVKVMNSSKWNLLEHGGSIGSSYLTSRGKILLQFFKDFGTNDVEWPMWWCSCTVDEAR